MNYRLNIYEKFKDIKNTSKSYKLIFFIGADISRLSNYLGMRDLINKNEKIILKNITYEVWNKEKFTPLFSRIVMRYKKGNTYARYFLE